MAREHPPPVDPANTLGLDYRELAAALPFRGPVSDVHTHVTSRGAAELYLEVASRFGVDRTLTMTGLAKAREVHAVAGDRIEFICVPDFLERKTPGTFTTRWLDDIRGFREELGSRVIKFWAAPRAIDLAEETPGLGPGSMALDSPLRLEGMRLAYDLGYRVFMTHVADPDTWFATKYGDAARYGTKAQQYEPLERLLDAFHDVTWIGAHMSGSPENLDFVQGLLDRHPNYVVDTSAAKWQVRELSKHPEATAAFIRRNPGRVLFGTDIVASEQMHQMGEDLFASRYWVLRTLFETEHRGKSPIVDPDLHMVDPSVPEDATPDLNGCGLEQAVLELLYRDALETILPRP
ncbi:amidohydrolase family protein [Phycisphaera mikurensis]|uniref:Amidohydrolase-related domain-containing protein n=1 Tax=Phycisphaera mikurensis (strain NBRC 102666 / KCTC 22515 / FYK2301M01) TaxID=1142394 RepID=I0IIT6_PHYMF|nr:amidohydrolase family protein [Phycisphaera mikurensis]MBB6442682.1 hypothetical protein [Phycisphaera mikurensis]BAM05174.1 hypothetical protein PSMK_30150 [Phycisphaera mikurensis NBRC 102666]